MTDGVIIVGAGVSGLTTAYELVRLGYDGYINILEASDHWGGRVEQVEFGGRKLDMGGAWLQAPPSTLRTILDRPPRETRLAPYEPGFSVFEFGKWDDTKSHTFEYQTFIGSTWYEFIEQNILPSVEGMITYGCAVDVIDYSDPEQAFVACADDNKLFTGGHVVVTPSVNVLNKIIFVPELPINVQDALQKVEWTKGFKLFLEFSNDFYRDQFSIFVPQYWAYNEHNFFDATFNQPSNGRHVLGFIASDNYYDLYANMTEQEIVDKVLQLLDVAYNGTIATDSYMSHMFKDWGKEQHIEGVWSWYDEWRHGSTDLDVRWEQLCGVLYELLTPIGNSGQMFLSGEAVAPDGNYGLVSGAALSGKTTACRIMGGAFEIGYHCVPPPTFSPRPTTSNYPTFSPTMRPTSSPSTTFTPSASPSSRSPSLSPSSTSSPSQDASSGSPVPTITDPLGEPSQGTSPTDLIEPGSVATPQQQSAGTSTKTPFCAFLLLTAMCFTELIFL